MALWPVEMRRDGARPRRQGESITSGWESSRFPHQMHMKSTLGCINANTQAPAAADSLTERSKSVSHHADRRVRGEQRSSSSIGDPRVPI